MDYIENDPDQVEQKQTEFEHTMHLKHHQTLDPNTYLKMTVPITGKEKNVIIEVNNTLAFLEVEMSVQMSA